jgi:hypothetical protein
VVISNPAATDPQLAAARALIEKDDPRPYVKVLEGGDLELTIVREGRVVRHVVDSYGRVTSVELRRRTRWHRGASIIAVGAWIALGGSAVAAGAAHGHVPTKLLVVTAVLSVALFVVAALAAIWTDSRLTKRYERDASVLDVVSLHLDRRGTVFGTAAQLLAAERLAAQHGDQAVVRRRGDGTVELVVETDGMLESLVVGRDGDVVSVHRAEEQADARTRLLRVVGVALIVGGFGAAWTIASWMGWLIFLGFLILGSGRRGLAARAASRYGGAAGDWKHLERGESSD